MEQTSKDNIYRYRTQTSMRIYITAITFSFIGTCTFAVLIWLHMSIQLSLHNHEWRVELSHLSFFFITQAIPLVSYIFYAVQEKLKTQYECIIVEDAGLRTTNWKQKELFLPWETIRELKLTELSGIIPTLPAKVIADSGKVSISLGVERREVLLDEIINRAQLTEKSGNWYQTRYSHPT